ncbi:MAG: SPOR domain-containing protein [Woeseiaceae bacterium]
MAKRKKRRGKRRSSAKKQQSYPGWLWMLFGLAIGLSVAFAIYVKDNKPIRPQPAAVPSAVDKNGEVAMPASATPDPEPASEKEQRFTFYDLLPAAEFVVPEKAPTTTEETNTQPEAVVEPGVYVLQAGSFSTNADADRRRAELALQGIESNIQRVTVNDREYHRVVIGPTDDLDELNLLRSRLRAAKIDVLRIRLSD